MSKLKIRHLAACLMAAALGFAGPVAAADFPAGTACAFDLDVALSVGHGVGSFREFYDKQGNVVRVLIAGSSPTLLFTNAETGEAFGLKSKGQAIHITVNSDGSSTQELTGQTVIVISPPDVDVASTTLYVGRVFVTIDTAGLATVQRASGNSTDICAILSD